MEVLCRVICSDGPIDLPYHQISDYLSFQPFYKNGKTQVTQEITDEAITYRIPHLHLDCTVEMLQYLLTNKVIFTVAPRELFEDEPATPSFEVVVAGHPNLSVVDVLYYNDMYRLAGPVEIHYGVEKILVDLIKEEMPTINPYSLLDRIFLSPHYYELEDFVKYDLTRFQDGTLNPDLVDDLAEIILPYLNAVFHDHRLYKDESLVSLDYFLSKYTGPVQFGPLRCRRKCAGKRCSMESNMTKYGISKFKDCPALFPLLKECYYFYC